MLRKQHKYNFAGITPFFINRDMSTYDIHNSNKKYLRLKSFCLWNFSNIGFDIVSLDTIDDFFFNHLFLI